VAKVFQPVEVLESEMAFQQYEYLVEYQVFWQYAIQLDPELRQFVFYLLHQNVGRSAAKT